MLRGGAPAVARPGCPAPAAGDRVWAGRRVPAGPRVGRAVPVPPAAAAIVTLAAAAPQHAARRRDRRAAAFLGARAWLAARAGRGSDGRLLALADGLGALAADLRSGRSLGGGDRHGSLGLR